MFKLIQGIKDTFQSVIDFCKYLWERVNSAFLWIAAMAFAVTQAISELWQKIADYVTTLDFALPEWLVPAAEFVNSIFPLSELLAALAVVLAVRLACYLYVLVMRWL